MGWLKGVDLGIRKGTQGSMGHIGKMLMLEAQENQTSSVGL